MVDGQTGYVDAGGELVIEPRFDFADSFAEGLAAVVIEGQTGYIDPEGQVVIEPQYEFAQHFAEGLAGVIIDNKAGYIDQEGQIVVQPQFDSGDPFSEGLAVVVVDGQAGYIDPTGELVIGPQFDFARQFSEGLAAVVVDNKTGYIDPTGQLVIEPQFDFGDAFSEGLAPVVINGQTGYIDREGQVVIEPRFDLGGVFEQGVAYAQDSGLWGYIDSSGRWLFQLPIADSLYGGGPSTLVIDYLPSVPDESQDGSCFTNAISVGQPFAWRCTVGNAIYDPCLPGDDGESLVCGANPATEEPGFQLNLTEPLPEPEILPVATPKTEGDTLNRDLLANATYTSEWTAEGVVKLNNGEYREQYDEASATELVITLDQMMAFGDLNQDNVEDAAVVLVVNPGGSGTFYQLAVVANDNGQPQHLATAPLGDRVELQSMTIDQGQVVVEMLTHGLNDPLCCPSVPVTRRYVLQGDEFFATAQTWLLQMSDGAICNFATGSRAMIEEKMTTYYCSDGGVILGDLRIEDNLWQAQKVILSETESFTYTDSQILNVSTVWPPVDPAQVQETVGLSLDEVSLDVSGVAQSVQGHLTPGTPYNPNVPPILNGEPDHLAFTFDGEARSPWFVPSRRQLFIYPVEDYQALYEQAGFEGIDNLIGQLQTILQEQPQPVRGNIPVLPDFPAAQVFRAQVQYLEFQNGTGIRFITHYRQDVGPITNDEVFYTFQGLTDDGRYYVSLFHPVQSSVLPDSYEEAEVEDWDAFAQNFETYLAETTQSLNGLAPEDYTPSLTALDDMVRSIQVGR